MTLEEASVSSVLKTVTLAALHVIFARLVVPALDVERKLIVADAATPLLL